jgi:hypothetical protein
MSAPPPDPPLSISSSGHLDGLGRRVLVFDREDGTMLEALHVRPEVSAFETALRERVARLAAFEDERFARIRGLERDPDTGDLVVISQFVPGSRLSDLLDVAQEHAAEGITPGVDVALGYLVEALPAIAALHAAAGMTHGAIASARTVLTSDGGVVFLDTAYGEVLQRLRFSRKRLWYEFRLGMTPAPGIPPFDAASDIGQIALNAVMLVLGRPLRLSEYPAALPALMMEVVEVAQIRGSSNFAAGIQRFLERALPLPGRHAYGTADEATIDIRQVARQEIGLPVCRNALIEFVAETTDGLALLPERSAHGDVLEVPFPEETAAEDADTIGLPVASSYETFEPEVDSFAPASSVQADSVASEPPLETSPTALPPVEEFASALADADGGHAPVTEPAFEPSWSEPAIAEPPPTASLAADIYSPQPSAAEQFVSDPIVEAPAAAESFAAESSEHEHTEEEPGVDEPLELQPDAQEAASFFESPRRKRQRSARARKDKLRSIASAGQAGSIGPQPRAVPPPLVAPDRAAAFDSDDFTPAPRAIGFAPPATPAAPPAAPAQPAFAPAALAPPAGPIPMPQFPAAPPSPYGGPSTTIWSAPPVAEPPAAPVKPLAPPPPKPLTLVQPAPSSPVPIKLKTDTGNTWTPKAPRVEPRPEPRVERPQTEPYAPLPELQLFSTRDEPRAFPWKLAAAGLVIVALGILGGRWYLADGRTPGGVEKPAATATPDALATAPAVAPPANAGHIDIQTQPPGAHVLLDGQAVGDSPLKLDVAPGRHVLTFVSASGSIKRNVRVDAGKSISLDVPLFSGWVALFAPVVLEVAENGKPIGSTEDGRIMLAPGRHELTVTNKDLGYTATQSVDIEPGEVFSLNMDPRGAVNFNAIPWAEVWIDGKKAGDTPLANAQVPLGVREIVFKNPDYGERKMVTTIRADTVGAVSVDFTSK